MKPNKPDLLAGLVPIIYIEPYWYATTPDNPNWYNYDEQKWANAAILTQTGKEMAEKGAPLNFFEGVQDIYAMFVWIPRFSYTIGCTDSSSCLGYKINKESDLSTATPGAIDIKFVPSKIKEIYTGNAPTYTYTSLASRTPSNWYTHPAFTFGDKELSGIWVGKFETSTYIESDCYKSESLTNCNNDNQTPYIIPDVKSLRYQTIRNQFVTAQKFTTANNIYGLTGDAHVMKNSEWGAIAYLSQSIYGKYGNKDYTEGDKKVYVNNSSGYYTGRSGGLQETYEKENGDFTYDDRPVGIVQKENFKGTGASTTGNIYGIYDMNGGAHELVMGNYNNTPANSGFDSAWFKEETNKKYFDSYINDTDNSIDYSSDLFSIKNKITNGGALAEIFEWYGGLNNNFATNKPWLTRGDYYFFSRFDKNSIFTTLSFSGLESDTDSISFRVSLVSTN